MRMLAEYRSPPAFHAGKQVIRLGYVPLVDSAPLLVAEREGLFAKRDLDVRLSREPGWASIREKLLYGEIDAAQCLGGLVLALNYGISCQPKRALVPLILNANGNAITFSSSITPADLENTAALQKFLNTRSPYRALTLATVHPFSSHRTLLHQWSNQRGLPTEGNVNIIYLPPPIAPRALAAGTIDAFCVGEPWGSHAILSGHGWCAATSVDLDNGHPEKVLAVSADFEATRPDDTVALTAALREACALCDKEYYRPQLIKLLHSVARLGTTAESIANSLGSKFRFTASGPGRPVPGFHLFSGDNINRPSADKASWIVSGMRQTGLLDSSRLHGLTEVFRTDIYDAASATSAALAAN